MNSLLKSITLLMVVVGSVSAAASVNVPNDYWGYAFLDRMEAKGLIQSFELRSRPISRIVFADLLRTIERRFRQRPDLFSRSESRLLDQLKGDFFVELKLDLAKSLRERHAVSWQEGRSTVYLDLFGQQSLRTHRGGQIQPDQLISETAGAVLIRGNLDSTIGFYLDARNTLTRGDDTIQEERFDPSQGSPVVLSGKNVYQDRALAYTTWQSSWLRLELGRDEFYWGPGFHNGLSISANMPATEMIRLGITFQRFKFSYLHAFLRSGLASKYLAGHRLDFKIMPGLYAGATETVIYGNRDVEFAYLNPIMPFHIAQHHLGDKDNKTISLDLTGNLWAGGKLYAEYFIDDMTTTKSLTKYFGNKFAFLLGGHWVEPLRLQDVDLRMEYTRVEPFVYTHWDSINIYTHYDQIIGSSLGPNADGLFLQIGWQPLRDLRVEGYIEQQRKGEGEADTHSKPAQGVNKKFLNGMVEKKQMIGFRLIDQIRRDLFVSIGYTYVDIRNLHRQRGRSSFDHLARFECSINY